MGNKRAAFTLIELLVVITIIAILAGLLFPVFSSAKAAANGIKAVSNGRQLGLGFQLYMDDNDDTYPQACDGTPGTNLAGGWIFYSTFGNTVAGTFDPSKGSVFPYVKSKEIFQSPSDADAKMSGDSFAMNGFLAPYNGTGLNPGKVATEIANPSSTMLIGEEGTGQDQPTFYGYINGTNDGYLNTAVDHFSVWHPGGTVVVFCDTHTKIVRARENFNMTLCAQKDPCP